MKSWDRPVSTHLDIVDTIIDLSDLSADEGRILRTELRRFMTNIIEGGRWMEPHITDFHTRWYREIYRVAGVSDPFTGLKRRSNEHAAAILAELEIPDLRSAVAASVIANLLDFGSFRADRMTVALEDFRDLGLGDYLHDDYDRLERELLDAKRVLYLLDNSGEVLFDKVVVDRLLARNPGCEITVAGKASPMLNDVTVDDLAAVGFDPRCRFLSTGSNCFGVPRAEVSDEFLDAFERADVVIAKGQAYFEFWIEFAADKVFNLLITKVLINDLVLGDIPPMSRMVIHSSRYASGKPPYATAEGRTSHGS